MKFLVKFTLISLLCISCNKDQYISNYKVLKEAPENKVNQFITDQSNGQELPDYEFGWEAPDSWIKSENTSSMRLATFQVPFYGYDPSKIEYADLSISVLSGDGGGLKMNVNRWRGQIGLEPQTLNAIISSAQNLENSIGSYQIFKLINKSSSDMAFICAVMPFQDNTIFVKLNISKIGINLVDEDFEAFCQTFRLLED